ncbi:MAG TPA: hypothetical protein VJZ77_11420 [Blastocatellia bacterium]|nr:hypothetical protein [Blastocatellia bacterium]
MWFILTSVWLSIFRTCSLISEHVQKYSSEGCPESTEKFEHVQLSDGRPTGGDIRLDESADDERGWSEKDKKGGSAETSGSVSAFSL